MKGRERAMLGALLAAVALGVVLVLVLTPRGERSGGRIDPGREPGARGTAGVLAPPEPAAPAEPERAPAGRDPAPAPAGAREVDTATQAYGRVAGTVVLEDGRTPAPGVAVLLTEGPTEPDAAIAVEALLEGDPRRLSTTDEAGRFAFVGLDPALTYSLVMGGGGRIGAQRRWPVRPDREERTYSLHRLYGARVRLREPGGAAIRLHPGLQGQRVGRSMLQLPGVFPLYGAPAGAVLAGVEPGLLVEERLDDRLLLYTSAQPAEELSPIQFRADYPGYERIELELAARFVAEGLSEYDVELAPTALGFGTLVIDVSGWGGSCPAFDNPRGPAALLRLQSTRGELLTFELPGVDGSRVEVPGLPYGTWHAVVMLGSRVSSPARRRDESQTVVIGPAPARYDLDLSGSASLILDVQKADGSPHAGHVSFLYGRESAQSRAWRTQHFLQPPYRLDELEPGTYRVVLQIPFDAGTSPATPLLVTARGGECTRVELREE